MIVEGEEVRLTATEYKILLLFMEHPGQVFSAEQIYENVWEEEANFTVENTVMVHIRHIREKDRNRHEKTEIYKGGVGNWLQN